jgi:D-alanyl-D-alanine carboxypeptidase/D-alanyl-D-alanine-endopeptidase (penicillin-binding protein 4)
MRILALSVLATLLATSCSVSKQLQRSAQENVLKAEDLKTAHVGISVFEPATGKYWFNYQGDKYFVPASNTKLPTCYAAMKYLGDSLVGARIAISEDGVLELYPSGDPTFLLDEFKFQPLVKELQKHKVIRWDLTAWASKHWGSGWSWSDYDADYMAERSPLPIYGNVMRLSIKNRALNIFPRPSKVSTAVPDSAIAYNRETGMVKSVNFTIDRALEQNDLFIKPSRSSFTTSSVPFRTSVQFVSKLLEDTLRADNVSTFTIAPGYQKKTVKRVIHSQPTDSVLKPMMHRSDNFFAEQSLLMVSNELFGVMNDNKIIDTILKTDFADLPQKPRWVDGSGLSRYNLFTPQDFVAILNKMKNEFGMARIKEILPTGGEGTLSSYYKKDSTFIYAKTGTLSGVVALSGFLYTKGGKELIFSVLVNNHNGSATNVRRAVEKFVQGIRERY